MYIFLLMIKSNKEGNGIERVIGKHIIESLNGMTSEGLMEKVTFE